jgi:Flp pilus assembly protein TadG
METPITVEVPAKKGPLKRLFLKFRQTETGQALVEFTMVLPVLLVLLFGLVDFGRAFYSWLLVTNAAREGARVAAVQSTSAQIDTRIHDALCSSYPSNCSINMSKLTITKTNVQAARGNPVTIDLSYNFQYATPIGGIIKFLGVSNLKTPVIKGHSSMRLE